MAQEKKVKPIPVCPGDCCPYFAHLYWREKLTARPRGD